MEKATCGCAGKELTLKLIFESIIETYEENKVCLVKLNRGEMNVKAVFIICLADSAGVLFSKSWPLPLT